jgi:hypothetical protein
MLFFSCFVISEHFYGKFWLEWRITQAVYFSQYAITTLVMLSPGLQGQFNFYLFIYLQYSLYSAFLHPGNRLWDGTGFFYE